MKPRFVLSTVLAASVLSFAVPGAAQQKTVPDTLPADGSGQGQQGGAGPGTTEKDKAADAPKSSGNVSGASFNDKPAAGAAPRARLKATGPTVAMPGFEQSEGGGSRFYVQLSQTVPVEERRAQGSITYVLKGASARVYNNTNALVTVHFSTPVSRARLVQAGADLLFILDLRAASTPTFKIGETTDKGSQLTVEFPKGDWLNAPPIAPDPAAPKPAVRATGKKKK